jgi:multidrug transporter EmrE-like cation transporter
MAPFSTLLLGTSTLVFVAAASAAKSWALSNNNWLWLVLTLALYTVGNLIMLRLIRDVGMGVALSLSAVVQLVAVNIVALAIFGEKVAPLQVVGIVLGVVSVLLITLPRSAG